MAVTLSEVTKLYVATFNRAPDAAGINYWANSGMSIENIAQSFFDQPETQSLYPSNTANSSFVTSVYDNLFNRTPDTAGLDYWVQELNNGNVSKQNFILAVINGAQNTTISQDATILTNKQTVGLDFVEKGLEDIDLARSVMEHVDATDASVANALETIVTNSLQVYYIYESSAEDIPFEQGRDGYTKLILNADNTVTGKYFTAPYGTSEWTWIETYHDMTWSLENNILSFATEDGDVYTQVSQTDTSITVSTGDQTLSFSKVPLVARTQTQIVDILGFTPHQQTFSGHINFMDATGEYAITPPSDLKLHLHSSSDTNYEHDINFIDIADDGSFSATVYIQDGFFTNTESINLGVYGDTNNNGNLDENEGYRIQTDLTLADIASQTFTFNSFYTLQFTQEMIDTGVYYIYDADLEGTFFTQGKDSYHKITLNADHTLTTQYYEAAFDANEWVLVRTDSNQTWNFSEGKLRITEVVNGTSLTDVVSIINQTDTALEVVGSLHSHNFYAMSTLPLNPRSEAEIMNTLGLHKQTFAGHINLIDNAGHENTISPSNLKIYIKAPLDLYDIHQISNIEINDDGTFNSTVYVDDDFFTDTNGAYLGIYYDTNNNGIKDGTESPHDPQLIALIGSSSSNIELTLYL